MIIAKPYDAEVMRKSLERLGYNALVALWGGETLLETLERETPALVLISLRKNQIGTDDLLTAIRAGRHGKDVPLLLISVPTGVIMSMDQAVALGADTLLLRPLDPADLDQTIKSLWVRDKAAEEVAPVHQGSTEAEDAAGPGHEASTEAEDAASAAEAPTGGDETEPALPHEPLATAVSMEVLPRRGELGDLDIPQLLYRAHREGLTGKLILRREETSKVVFFDDGDPVFATSEQPYDRMGAFLRRQGKITDSQYVEFQRLMRGADERLGSILVRKGFVKPRELTSLVRDHVAEIIYSIFSWSNGEYRIDDAGALVMERIKLESAPVILILEGVRRKYGLHRLRPLVGPPTTQLCALPQAGVRARRYGFTETEVRALEQLDGELTLGQLIETSHRDELGIYQLCYVALLVGLAQRGTAQPGAPEVRISAGAPREGVLDRLRIQSKHAQVCEGTYFNLLGLQTDATGHEVLRAFERLRVDFAPGAIAPEVVEECAEQLREINEVIEEAFRVLQDDALREAYRRSIT